MIIVKRGSFPQLDLSLISMDPGKIPDSLRERDMPLCREQPPTGAPVILERITCAQVRKLKANGLGPEGRDREGGTHSLAALCRRRRL